MSKIIFLNQYIKEKYWFIFGYMALILESLTPIIAISFQRELIDEVFIDHHYSSFYSLMILYCIFYFAPKLFFTVRRVIFSRISYDLHENLIKNFIESIYNMPKKSLDTYHVGQLVNHMRQDITTTSELYVNECLAELVKIVVSIVFLTIAIVRINPLLLLIALLISIAYYFLMKVFGKQTKHYAGQVQNEKGKVSSCIEEHISSVRETVAFSQEASQMKQFNHQFQRYYKAIVKEGLLKAKILMVSDPMLYGIKIIVLLIGGLNVINQKISLGDFVVSFTLVNQLVTEIGALFNKSMVSKRLSASLEAFQHFLTGEKVDFGNETLTRIQTITFDQVSFAYDDELIFNELSLELPVGKKIAFVGASGSGKSTIAQLLIRNYQLNHGAIMINGKSHETYDASYKNKIGIVFQQPHFMPLSIQENMVFDGSYEAKELLDVSKKLLVDDFVKELPEGYETMIGEKGANLSGGQKQRIALVRALLKNPDVLILDEATSALDTQTEYLVQKHIDEMRVGKTTIIIAHRLSTILNADLIVVLDKGEVVSTGTHEELIKTCLYYQQLYVQEESN